METFFESLATHDLTAEPRYWRYVVANEVKHNPLFKDVAESLFKFSAQINPQPDEINQLRISLLTGIESRCVLGVFPVDLSIIFRFFQEY